MFPREFSADTQRQAAAFDRIANQYTAVFGDNPAQRTAIEWLLQRLPAHAQVLDIGSGTGMPTAHLLAEAGHEVVGIDISLEMVRIAQQQVPHATFYQMDAAVIHLERPPFHAITAFFSLLMLRRSAIEHTLQHLPPMLQPPGYLVISMIEGDFDYIEIPFLGQPLRVSAYPRAAFTQLLEMAHFQVVDLQAVAFQAGAEAPPETQLFYYCQQHI